MKKVKIISVLLVLGLSGFACSSEFRNSFIDRLPEDVGELFSDPGSIATLVVDEVENLNNEVGEGNIESPHPDVIEYGLSELESYRFRFVQTFVGKDEQGNEIKITVKNEQEIMQAMQITHMRMESASDVKPLQFFDVYRFGNDFYILDESSACTAYSENPDQMDTYLGLSAIFSNLELGKLVERGVNINGTVADHYQVLNVSMVNSMLNDVKGDIWFAQKGGFIVRFYGSADGEAYSEIENTRVDGTVNWEFDLSDVNAIVDIPLPVACQVAAEGGIKDIPVPENAQDVSRLGSMLSFNSSDDLNILADYYRSTMLPMGYQLVDETVYEEFIVLTYEKAEETITIMLSGVNRDGSDAIITVEVK